MSPSNAIRAAFDRLPTSPPGPTWMIRPPDTAARSDEHEGTSETQGSNTKPPNVRKLDLRLKLLAESGFMR
jgi:hypothetical protein